MAKDSSARDIHDRTFKFALRIVNLCQHLDARPGVARLLGRQLLRSGTSIGANVEESVAGQSRADFVSKMMISLKESRETLYWLRLVAAARIVEPALLGDIQKEGEEISRVLGSIVVSTKRRSSLLTGGILLAVLLVVSAVFNF
ncbi:MAG TPA: four helix bundle protein [Planctomycetota bacterium]